MAVIMDVINIVSIECVSLKSVKTDGSVFAECCASSSVFVIAYFCKRLEAFYVYFGVNCIGEDDDNERVIFGENCI